MSNGYTFYAFISYKREDERWAKWLQNKLEHYKFPTNLNGRTDLPKNIRPTFRDVTDLTPGLLAEEIDKALRSSEWLIVICSPRSAKSPWVCKEAQTFIGLGRADHIIPFVIEGNPFSKDNSTECYPEALLNLTDGRELLGANINEMGRDAAAIKVVARMFNLRFDTLWQRFEREQKRKKSIYTVTAILLAILGLSVGVFFIKQNRTIRNQNIQLENATNHLRHDSIALRQHLLRIQKDSIKLILKNDSIQKQKDSLVSINKLLYIEKNNVLSAKNEVLKRNARAISNKAMLLVEDGASDLASKILAEVYPTNENKDYPYVAEVEDVIRVAYSNIPKMALTGHKGSVITTSYSPDGKYIVSSSSDYAIKIWEVETGICKKQIQGGKYAEFSPDGKYIVSASVEDVHIRDIKTGKILKTLKGHTMIHSISFSPKGKHVMSISTDGNIKIWDVETGICTRERDGYVNSGNFSPDGRYIVYTAFNTILLWNLDTNEVLRTFEGHTKLVNTASFSHDGRYIVSASDDRSIKLWDVESGKLLRTYEGHTDCVKSASFSPDGKYIVSASNDGTIRLWKTQSEYSVCVNKIKGHTDWVLSVSFSPNGKYIVSASRDKTIKIWDLDKHTTTLPQQLMYIRSASFSPDGNKIVSGAFGGSVCLWNSRTGDCYKKISTQGTDGVIFSPDGRLIASRSIDIIELWDIETSRLLRKLEGHAYNINSISFSPDGKKIVSSSNDESVKVWDVQTGDCLMTLNGHTYNVMYALFSPDGKWIVSASADKTARLWDAETGNCTKVLGGHTNHVNYAAFSSDGKNIISVSGYNPTIKIWDVNTGDCFNTITGFKGEIKSVLPITPDWKYILLVDRNTIGIWNIETVNRVNILQGHTDQVQCASFSLDGSHIVSASYDKSVKIWDFLPIEQILEDIREHYMDNPLTEYERKKFYLE